MPRKFLTPIDLVQNELQNAVLQNLASAPSTPRVGQVYYDTTVSASFTYNGTIWACHDAAKLVGAIPNAALATNPLARANHTGTQISATISDLAATVQSYRLDQHAAAGANIPMAGFRFTGLGTPTAAGDSAEYSWVIGQIQSAAAGIASKPPVRLVATSNIGLSGLAAIDGVTPVVGDRVLVTGQTTAAQNGVYNAAASAWTRTTVEGPPPGELETGAMWLVTEGTTYAGSQWRVSTTGAITVGTTSVAIVQFNAAMAFTAGNGLSLTGSTLAVNPIVGGGLTASPSGLAIDTSVVARKFSATIGDGAASSFVVSHGLGTQDVVMMVRQAAAPFAAVESRHECDQHDDRNVRLCCSSRIRRLPSHNHRLMQRLSTFPADVRGVVLAGLSTATAAIITSADTVLSAFGRLQAQISWLNSSATGLVATGTNQATALVLTAAVNQIVSAPAGTGVKLPDFGDAREIVLLNNSSLTLTIYPPSGYAIDTGATNAAVTTLLSTVKRYRRVSATQFCTC